MLTAKAEVPPGLIVVKIPKALLVLTLREYAHGIKRGKWWRRQQEMVGRDARPGPAATAAGKQEGAG